MTEKRKTITCLQISRAVRNHEPLYLVENEEGRWIMPISIEIHRYRDFVQTEMDETIEVTEKTKFYTVCNYASEFLS